MRVDDEALERMIVDAIARACRAETARVERRTPVAEIGLDSLTLVAVLTELEARLALDLDADATLRLLECDDVGELIALISRLVPAGRLRPPGE